MSGTMLPVVASLTLCWTLWEVGGFEMNCISDKWQILFRLHISEKVHAAGSTLRNSVRVAKRRGQIVMVWTNAEKWGIV
jgi:hypothetical protein